jgi:hypothetical protein
MAQLPLNKFLTKTVLLSSSTTATVYTAPIGSTCILLMAQVANLSTNTVHYVTFEHYRYKTILADAQGFGGQPGRTASMLVKNYAIPFNDAGTPLTGKMIIEELDSVRCYAETSGTMQLVMSILQTANS